MRGSRLLKRRVRRNTACAPFGLIVFCESVPSAPQEERAVVTLLTRLAPFQLSNPSVTLSRSLRGVKNNYGEAGSDDGGFTRDNRWSIR